ncbi:MAG: hypothetical protein J6U54_11250 [Clostridiales bacterium]|nr:hypothetical protein [Clostridiales bacterium]
MYMFWFNGNHRTDDTIYCSKIVRVLDGNYRRKKEEAYIVELDPNGAIPKSNKWNRAIVSKEEGKVWQRRFWLSTEDYEKAMDIVNDYLKERWLKVQRQADNLRGGIAM